jgi:long-chain acyl-CoA synthetase
MPTNLTASFVKQVASRPLGTAVITHEGRSPRRYTWSHLASLVYDVAGALEAQLSQRPEVPRRVIHTSNNSLVDLVLALASPVCGAVEVPIDDRSGGRTTRELQQRVDGLWLETDAIAGRLEWLSERHGSLDRPVDPLPALRAAARRIDVDEPALVLWTSGTSGRAKGVVLSHRNLYGNALAKWQAVPQTADDVRLTSLPLSHAYARTCDLGTWLLGGGCLALGSGFTAWQTLGPVAQPTVANTVPGLARRLRDGDSQDLGLDHLRLLGCGGAAMDASDFFHWRSRGVTVIQGYGLTEASPVICSATPENALPGLVGEPVQGWECRFRGDRLYVRGPHTMLGYFEDDESTRRRMDHDGWLDTGDLVQIDEDSGQFRVLGRADDAIVLSSGHLVHPRQIEEEIEQVVGIRHALVVGGGRQLHAWLDAEATADRDHVTAQVIAKTRDRPRWEQPSQIHFFETPLSIDSGDLTTKGSLRRAEIIKKRIDPASKSDVGDARQD